ncbi:hypothetical protein F4778DRAFT_743790 [Xylariomycetidae sp. FL2044]|nr:hypothetical protein F4778DRAFT_743790 [Xylariomycetidae sp. FL2044]
MRSVPCVWMGTCRMGSLYCEIRWAKYHDEEYKIMVESGFSLTENLFFHSIAVHLSPGLTLSLHSFHSFVFIFSTRRLEVRSFIHFSEKSNFIIIIIIFVTMPSTLSLSSTLLLGLASAATAHYTFDQLVVNGVMEGTSNTYIRAHTRGYMPTKGTEILETDFRCNQAAAAAAPSVMAVVAGDRVALKQAYGGTGMVHPGPTQVYMSRAAPSGAAPTGPAAMSR